MVVSSIKLKNKTRLDTQSGSGFQIDENTKNKLVENYQQLAAFDPYGHNEKNQQAFQDVSEKFNVLNAEDLDFMKGRPTTAYGSRNIKTEMISSIDSSKSNNTNAADLIRFMSTLRGGDQPKEGALIREQEKILRQLKIAHKN